MGEFHFLRPWALLAVLPLAAMVWGLWRARSGAGTWSRAVDPHLLPHLVQAPRRALRLPLVLTAAAWLLGVVALAGPTWSRAPAVRFETPLVPLVVVLDLSRSMEAVDVGTSRLDLARARLVQLLERLPPRRYGVAVFAGTGHMVLPLTDDPRLFAGLLPQLGPDLPPLQGSNASAGLEQAREILRRAEAGAADVLLVADGADPAATEVAHRLQASGARVAVMTVGTADGRIADDGREVAVAVDEPGLRAVALAGKGAFVDARHDVAALAEALSAAHAGPDGVTRAAPDHVVWRDEGPLLVLALLPLAALAFRRGWLGAVALLWLLQTAPAEALDWRDLWQRPDQRAQGLMERGDGLAAAELFSDPMRRGAALYRGGDFSGAADSFAQAEGADAHYNRGNALVRLGRLAEARNAYEWALAIDPAHGDARFNLSLVKEAIGAPDRQPRPPAPHRDEREPPPAEKGDGPPPERVEAPGRSGQDGAARPDEPGKDGSGTGAGGGGRESGGEAASAGGQGGEQGSGQTPGAAAGTRQAQGSSGDAQAADGQQGEAAEAAEARPAGGRDAAARSGPGALPSPHDGGQRRDEQGQAAASAGEGRAGPPGSSGATGSGAGTPPDEAEHQQALEQWLERIPDDPSRLLKELFRRQNERARSAAAEGPPW